MVMVLGKPRRLGHVLGVVIAILAGLMFAMHGLGAVAWLAAAGAGIGADFVVHRNSSLRDLAQRFRWPRRRRPRSASSVGRASARSAEPDIDDILAKISQSGLDSLTEDERSRLEAARQAKLRHGSDVNTLS
jgi:hypothetical protein